ncbi:hypothetical protein [Georgenia alba]|uniref:Uncharacterized protein n=1 Tax=Georgenia alba TaxID=2233858 RepID=A0ABW2Q685_9MICO
MDDRTAVRTDARADLPAPWPGRRFVVPIGIGVVSGGVLMLGGVSADSPAVPVGVAVLAYLAAGATGMRWMAWAWVVIASLIMTVTTVLDVSWWPWFAVAGALIALVGLLRRPRATAAQVAAMLGYFGVAVLALYLEPRIGLALAGLALAAHAGWDYVHYRKDVVVHRVLAVWCMGLDLTAGLASLVIAALG